jgi:hypothetical protein
MPVSGTFDGTGGAFLGMEVEVLTRELGPATDLAVSDD